MSLLQVVAAHPNGAKVSDLARLADLPRVTASRMLGTLANHGMLHRREDGTYVLGPELARFGRQARDVLLTEARGPLERVLAECNETVTLTLSQFPGKLETVFQLDPKRVVMTDWRGIDYPLHASSAGKIFLAYMDPGQRRNLLPSRLKRFTERTITNRSKLEEHLTQVRAVGWADNDQEYELGLSSVSVPVTARNGDAFLGATLDISGPTGRLTKTARSRAVEILTPTADSISAYIHQL